MKTYYVGMDVHRASIVIVVLNGAGKIVMQSVIETGAERVRGFLKQLRGKVYVTFEEGTQALPVQCLSGVNQTELFFRFTN